MLGIRRREFITAFGGAAAAWPIAARAQQRTMPVIGFLYLGSPEPTAHLATAFRKGLSETGYDEGRNVAIEYRWAHNEYDRLPQLVADLLRRRVAVIVTPGGSRGALVAKAATASVPIVFSFAPDPVQLGVVASLNRPGGNVTGINSMNVELHSKLIGILSELVPKPARLAMLIEPASSTDVTRMQATTTAEALGRQIEFFHASSNREIDAAFAGLVQKQIKALMVPTNSLFETRRVQIATLAARYAVPVIYASRDYVVAGGLMSYGTSSAEVFRQVGIYAGRILNGEKPAELPVMRPTKFEFVINLQTARTIDIDIPATLLAQADEIIE